MINEIHKLIRVMSPLSGGDGGTVEYRLESGDRKPPYCV